MKAIEISGTADGGFLVERKFAGVTSERFVVNSKRECPRFKNGGFLGQPAWKREAVAILQTERRNDPIFFHVEGSIYPHFDAEHVSLYPSDPMGWYFWTEDFATYMGPYDDYQTCFDCLRKYCEWLNMPKEEKIETSLVPELDHPLHSTLQLPPVAMSGTTNETKLNPLGSITVTRRLLFDELQVANLRRVGLFKNRLGNTAHARSDGSDWTLAEWTNAMAGEVGEACNLSKKLRRGDFMDDPARGIDLLLDELADVVIYADLVASQCGASLGEAIIKKFNSKSDEIGCDVKIHGSLPNVVRE